MSTILTRQQQEDLLSRGFSRRTFGRIATFLTAGAALPFYNEPALAQRSAVSGVLAGSVMINSNENPLGPSAEAREAATAMIAEGGRYHFELPTQVASVLQEQEDLKPGYVNIQPGSSLPLHWAVLAFCSPSKPFVAADPGYEAGSSAARYIGAKVINTKLTKDYAHDVKAMVEASPDSGLIYVCNPNNPTGTLTKKSDIEWLVANKPKGTIVMIDEAYTHISGAPFNSDLVRADKDVVILRTFSKIYGMAGLRAGAVLARPDLIQAITKFSGGSGMLPVTSMAAAKASLLSKDLIPKRRKMIGDVREDVLSFLDQHGFKCVPSVSNCFMVDVRRPGGEVQRALMQEKVVIGRTWSAWPNHVRVTVGTQDEMDKFKSAFLKVMA